jgi:hypothetical protein
MTALDFSTNQPTRHTAKVLETEGDDLDYRCAGVLTMPPRWGNQFD